MIEIFKHANYNFMRWKWLWLAISGVTITFSLIYTPIHGIKKAVEFTGGVEVILRYVTPPHLDTIRRTLDSSGLPSVSVTTFGETGGQEIDIRAGLPEQKPGEERDLARRITGILTPPELQQKLAAGQVDLNTADQATIATSLVKNAGMPQADADRVAESLATFRREHGGVLQDVAQAKQVPGLPTAVAGWIDQHAFVGPFGLRSQQVIEGSVSGEMRNKALMATLGALLGMLVYIWFRFHFQWGLGAIVALIHDTIFTIGLFSFFGYEANLPVVAAFLTLIGYSMNDTVVVFDRIRENMKTRGSAKFEQLINDSINETLSRTIITSFLTWLSVLALFIWGGPVLRPFSFVLLVGIIIGTYSSIYIASPILTIWLRIFNRRESLPTGVKGSTSGGKATRGARA